MKLRPERREDPEVNLTPLIDVVFLLLIFFMISTTFQREAELQVELPEASAEPTQRPERVLEITVNAQGEYFVNDQQVVNNRPETLKRAIRQVIGDERDLPVVVRADGQASHQSVVTVMDVVQQLGLNRLSLATTQAQQDE